MVMSAEAIATTMRPLVVKLERAVSQLIEPGESDQADPAN